MQLKAAEWQFLNVNAFKLTKAFEKIDDLIYPIYSLYDLNQKILLVTLKLDYYL